MQIFFLPFTLSTSLDIRFFIIQFYNRTLIAIKFVIMIVECSSKKMNRWNRDRNKGIFPSEFGHHVKNILLKFLFIKAMFVSYSSRLCFGPPKENAFENQKPENTLRCVFQL